MNNTFGKRVGGRLCLDFVNTVHGRVSGRGSQRKRDYRDQAVGERVVSYGALLRWATLAGALPAGQARSLGRAASQHPAKAAAVVARGLDLREAMYRIFKAAIERWPPPAADLAVLNRELRIARAHERLAATPGLGWEWDVMRESFDRVLWPVVRSAAELLTSDDLARVGQCPGEDCGWLFLDTSRSGRRQWCAMADCGNLAKVRRFRDQRRVD